MADPVQDAAARVASVARAIGLPDVSEGTSYGTPALQVHGKSFARLKDAQTLVLMCPLEQKELLLEMAPASYFETDHYRGWPAVLIRLESISDEELGQRLLDGWRHRAPQRLVKSHAAARGEKSA